MVSRNLRRGRWLGKVPMRVDVRGRGGLVAGVCRNGGLVGGGWEVETCPPRLLRPVTGHTQVTTLHSKRRNIGGRVCLRLHGDGYGLSKESSRCVRDRRVQASGGLLQRKSSGHRLVDERRSHSRDLFCSRTQMALEEEEWRVDVGVRVLEDTSEDLSRGGARRRVGAV